MFPCTALINKDEPLIHGAVKVANQALAQRRDEEQMDTGVASGLGAAGGGRGMPRQHAAGGWLGGVTAATLPVGRTRGISQHIGNQYGSMAAGDEWGE